MPYKFLEIKTKLMKLWFDLVRQKWSHVIFSNGKITFPVPNHWWKDISPWVESKILKFVELNKKEFNNIK